MKDISDSDLKNNIPLAAAKHDGHKSAVRVGTVTIGGPELTVMAGPCAIESEAQIQASLMMHPDFREAYDAFRAKRPPKFIGS